jgi:NOL1/NOP2/fmu family ribosome biogenesis protein
MQALGKNEMETGVRIHMERPLKYVSGCSVETTISVTAESCRTKITGLFLGVATMFPRAVPKFRHRP